MSIFSIPASSKSSSDLSSWEPRHRTIACLGTANLVTKSATVAYLSAISSILKLSRKSCLEISFQSSVRSLQLSLSITSATNRLPSLSIPNSILKSTRRNPSCAQAPSRTRKTLRAISSIFSTVTLLCRKPFLRT